MSQSSPVEIANWIAIYLATALCCAIAMTLSVTVTLSSLWRDRIWDELGSICGAALFLPKVWWRRQKLYILSTPVTLGIMCWFAATMRWS